MREVELEFMHQENDRIKKEATNEYTRLSGEIDTLKETQERMEKEREELDAELSIIQSDLPVILITTI